MYKTFIIAVVFLGLASCNNTITLNEPEGKRLRQIVAEQYANTDLLIGGTSGSWAFDSITGQILDREYSYVTPENDFKHSRVRQDSTLWKWKPADAWLQHIKSNNQVLRIHAPIGPQCANWTKGDSVAVDTLAMEIELFMKALCQRYNNAEGIIMLDVVNETVHEGDWKKDEPGYGDWELPWFRIGQNTDSLKTPLYITSAFELATKYAPNLKLIYNQHENPEQIDSWNMIKTTVQYLRQKGSRVDGIGWQAHVDDGWATEENLKHLNDLISWSFNNDLSFHITEASVWIDSTNINSNFASQAETYAKLFEVVLKRHTEGQITWNTWNIDDQYAWHKDRKPTLFDTNYKAKPSYYAIQKALDKEPY